MAAVSPRDRAASLAGLAAWIAAWSASMYAVYSDSGLMELTSATVLLLAAVVAGAAHGVPSRAVVVVAVGTGLAALHYSPPLFNVDRTAWLLPGVNLGAISLLIALGLLVPIGLGVRYVAALALLVTAGAYALVILGGTPQIDVWVLLQDAARGVLGGHNPYDLAFPEVPPGQDSWCFTYLPGTFLLSGPGQWLLGDARWAEAACLLAATGLLVWHVGQRSAWTDRGRITLAVLVGAVPGTLYMVQQAWTESMLLVALVVAAVLIDRGRANWAAVALGLALATKQHMVVLLPLMLVWPRFEPRRVATTGAVALALTVPWYLADPSRFLACTSDFFLGAPTLPTSLSLWRLVPEPVRLPMLVLGFAIAVVVVLRWCPRTGAGFLVGSGVLLSVFSLLNKQSFMNQWWFVGVLVIAGVAATTVRHGDGSDERNAPEGMHAASPR